MPFTPGEDADLERGAVHAPVAAENAEFADRLRQLGLALSRMASDLADTRRENALLRRENVRLQSRLDELSSDVDAAYKELLAGPR